MASKLHLADGLSLPAECVTEKLAFLGRTGSGKSYAAMKLAEEFARIGAQYVVLDPVGMWWGLRLAADGTSPGIDIPVLGGLHGDIPLESSAGGLVADLIVDRGTSCILDVSQFESDADRSRFAEAWASRFFYRKKSASSAVHVFVEEAQEFVPQNTQRGEERMLHAFQRLEKLGRNFGIGVSLISQRPQEVNKKALNQTELLFAFQMTGPQERKTIEGWIADKGVDEDISGELPKLARGEPHVWSPAWLKVSKTVHIGERWTFDASSTPKVGKTAAARELAPIDLDALRKQMAATIERAKADDPKALRAEIAHLKSALTRAHKTDAQTVDRPSIQAAVEQAVARSRATWDREAGRQRTDAVRTARRLQSSLANVATILSTAVPESLGQLLASLEAPTAVPSPANGNGHAPVPPRAAAAPLPQRARVSREVVPAEGVSRPQQRMLNALAAFEALGVDQMAQSHVAVFSNQSPRSSGFDKNMSTISALGLIERLGGKLIRLTGEGRAIADAGDAPASLAALHEAWLAKVSGPQQKMLRVLIDLYPETVEREALAASSDQSVTSSGFDKNESTLASLGLMARTAGRTRRAGDLLFPAGLA